MNAASHLVAIAIVAFQPATNAFAQNPIQPVQYEPQTWFIPRHVAGDREYYGHGPHFSVSVQLYIHPFACNEVWAAVTATASEVCGDTVASETRHVRVARFVRPICCILSPSFGTHEYVDTDCSVDTFYNPCASGLLNSVQYVGDTRGHEAGTRTGVLLHFNPVLAE
jgi:hypothetical protein